MTDMAVIGIEVEPIPPCLCDGQRAILVSNYPSVSEALRAIIKVVCRLPGQKPRLKAIARKSVLTDANLLLNALGLEEYIFPAMKDPSGKYTLEPDILRRVLAHLDGEGNLLWLSITGKTRNNGLLERDVRTGAASFSLKKNIPIVPMSLVTEKKRGNIRVVKIRFGEPIDPPEMGNPSEFEMGDLLLDISRLVMCQIAALLPPGQRGDFEDLENRVREARSRLSDQPLSPQ